MDTNITIKSTLDQQRRGPRTVDIKAPSLKIDEDNERKLESSILIRHPGKSQLELEAIKEHLSSWILYKAKQYKDEEPHNNPNDKIAEIISNLEFFSSVCPAEEDHYENNLMELVDSNKGNSSNTQDIDTNQKQYKKGPIAIDKLAESNFPEIGVGIFQEIDPTDKVESRIHDLCNKYQSILSIPQDPLNQAIKISPHAVLHGIETLINIHTILHETGCDKATQNSNETRSITLFLTRDPIAKEISIKEYKIHFNPLEKLRDAITALIISLHTQNYEELIKLSAEFDHDYTRFLERVMVHCEIAQRQLIVNLGRHQKWFSNLLKTPEGFDYEKMLCHFDHRDLRKEWIKPGVLIAEINTKFIKNLAPHLGMGPNFEILKCQKILPLMMRNPEVYKLVTLVQNLTSPSSSMAELFEISEQFLAQAKIIAETPELLGAITHLQEHYFSWLSFLEIVKLIDNTLEKYPPSNRLAIRLPIKDLEKKIEQLTRPNLKTFNMKDSIDYSNTIKNWIISTTELIQNTLKVLEPKKDMGLEDLSIKGIEYRDDYKNLITRAYERIFLELQYNYLTKVIIPQKLAEYDAQYSWTTRNIGFGSKANEYSRLIAPLNAYKKELHTLYKEYANPNDSAALTMDLINKMATIERLLAQIAI